MTRITTEVDGIERLRNKLRSPRLIAKPLSALLNRSAEIAEREARTRAYADRGLLARSISARVEPLGATISSTLSRATETGRKPGQQQPPSTALAGWAQRHGFTGSLFVLARAIARRGIRGRFFMQRALQKTQGAMPTLLRRMGEDVRREWER